MHAKDEIKHIESKLCLQFNFRVHAKYIDKFIYVSEQTKYKNEFKK